MGEVYRARDTKLSRDVAIKILPTEFAVDPDRLARFKREAQVLASLNPPNIAAIYDFEDFRRDARPCPRTRGRADACGSDCQRPHPAR
jgi:serine/threonine protein kinase